MTETTNSELDLAHEPSLEMLFPGRSTDILEFGLLIDRSSSMLGVDQPGPPPIELVNEAVSKFINTIHTNPIARRRVRTTLVSVGEDVQVHAANAEADALEEIVFEAGGGTPLGQGTFDCMGYLENGRQFNEAHNIGQLKPALVVLTDGAPTDREVFFDAMDAVIAAEDNNHLSFYLFTTADLELTEFKNIKTKHEPVKIANADIKRLFRELSLLVSDPKYKDDQITSAME